MTHRRARGVGISDGPMQRQIFNILPGKCYANVTPMKHQCHADATLMQRQYHKTQRLYQSYTASCTASCTTTMPHQCHSNATTISRQSSTGTTSVPISIRKRERNVLFSYVRAIRRLELGQDEDCRDAKKVKTINALGREKKPFSIEKFTAETEISWVSLKLLPIILFF